MPQLLIEEPAAKMPGRCPSSESSRLYFGFADGHQELFALLPESPTLNLWKYIALMAKHYGDKLTSMQLLTKEHSQKKDSPKVMPRSLGVPKELLFETIFVVLATPKRKEIPLIKLDIQESGILLFLGLLKCPLEKYFYRYRREI